jgi:hypothetical protein
LNYVDRIANYNLLSTLRLDELRLNKPACISFMAPISAGMETMKATDFVKTRIPERAKTVICQKYE